MSDEAVVRIKLDAEEPREGRTPRERAPVGPPAPPGAAEGRAGGGWQEALSRIGGMFPGLVGGLANVAAKLAGLATVMARPAPPAAPLASRGIEQPGIPGYQQPRGPFPWNPGDNPIPRTAPTDVGGTFGGPGQAAGGGVMGGLAIAGAVVGIAKTIEAVNNAIKEAMVGAVRSVTSFADKMMSPDADPSRFVDAIGGTISAVSDKMMKVVPVVGIFGGVLGEATNSLATFMHTMDGMVSRFADFSPGLAMAQVNADMRQMFGDFRRAQEAGPALASFLKARGDMQEKFEDMKVRLLNRAMPLIITGMKAVENLMPVAEAMLNMLTSVAEHVPGLGDKIDAIKKQMERERKLWEDAKPSTIDEIGRWFDNPIPSGPE